MEDHMISTCRICGCAPLPQRIEVSILWNVLEPNLHSMDSGTSKCTGLTNHSLLHVIMLTNFNQELRKTQSINGKLCQSTSKIIYIAQNPAL